ncbi:cold shock domain-containing protein [Steroidobacter agaridevorans]|uniref:cold shock domain-containing protein n=1 Tax=Steroidobacter agaridevorans TaxID=2695856 RepID=UPI00137B4AAB
MRGKVKWFSREKGYGFITDEQARNHYFSVQDVRGADLPASGDQVQFQSQDTSRGPRASGIQLIARSESAPRGDDRVRCGHCGRKMVPRLISYQGQVERSVCPFCAETYCDFLLPSSTLLWRWVALAVFVLVIFIGCLGSRSA